jgi:hypothetical protein
MILMDDIKVKNSSKVVSAVLSLYFGRDFINKSGIRHWLKKPMNGES